MDFTPFPILETERLSLRKLVIEDENALFTLRSDEQIAKYLDRPKAETLEDARAFIRKIDQAIANNESLYWVITLKTSGAVLGTICLWNFSADQKKAEVGYELLPDFQGQGFMQEAFAAVIDFCFAVLNLDLIEACPAVNNASSVKLLQRNNFVLESIFEEPYSTGTRSYQLAIYARRNPGG